VTAVEPTVATVARMANAFLMNVSSIDYPAEITQTVFDGFIGTPVPGRKSSSLRRSGREIAF
jgi:hypothetical protein